MTDFRPYPEYKCADMPWLDEIPATWDLKPLFALTRETNESNRGLIETNLLSLSYGKIVTKDISTTSGLLPASFDTYQVVQPGDIVLRLTDLQNDKRSLRSAIVSERGIITSAYLSLRFRGVDPRFAAYAMRDIDTRKVFYSMGGGLRQSLNYDDLKRMPFQVPPVRDQMAIVEFLDRETAELDAFIWDQEELIRLLEERRAATISHAVTKGLNRSEQLKHDRFPWLGPTPASWTVGPLKHFADILPGFAFSSSEFVEERSAISLLRGINVGVAKIDWAERVAWAGVLDPRVRRYELASGDLVLGLDRTIISSGVRLSTITAQDLPALLVQRVARIRAFQPNINRYLAYALGGDAFAQYVAPIFSGVSVPHLSTEQVGQFSLAVPPAEVQARIADFLDERVADIDATISDARESIDLMRERRAALISATVTGKIDVREREKGA